MNKKKLIIIIAIVVVLGVGGYFVYSNFLAPKDPAAAEAEAVVKLEELYFYIPGDYLVVNVQDGTSLTKTSVSMGMKGSDITANLEKNLPIIRNTLINILRTHSEEEFKQPEILVTLAQEFKDALNLALGIEDVHQVYITDFVMQ